MDKDCQRNAREKYRVEGHRSWDELGILKKAKYMYEKLHDGLTSTRGILLSISLQQKARLENKHTRYEGLFPGETR